MVSEADQLTLSNNEGSPKGCMYDPEGRQKFPELRRDTVYISPSSLPCPLKHLLSSAWLLGIWLLKTSTRGSRTWRSTEQTPLQGKGDRYDGANLGVMVEGAAVKVGMAVASQIQSNQTYTRYVEVVNSLLSSPRSPKIPKTDQLTLSNYAGST